MTPILLAEILAVVSAFTFAGGDVIGRIAVRYASPLTGALLSAAVSLIVFGAVVITAWG